MVSLIDLVNAMAVSLRNIPELEPLLARVDGVHSYIDLNPTANSVDKAIYQMQPGQLLVIWTATDLVTDTMGKWSHRVEICVRALREHSELELIQTVVNGVPVPGNGMPWRFCPLMGGLLPTNVTSILRRTDTEGVDYGVVQTETAETGDWPF
jgi:hypothetical protein